MQPVVRTLLLLGLLASLVGGAALAEAGPAFADTRGPRLSDEQRLALRYAPVVRLVAQPHACGPGEPYRPSDVNALFGNNTVALRGPWTSQDLIAVGPTARDLGRGLPGYSLDLPGDPLNPGCDYEKWAHTTFAHTSPTVYAHVATEAGFPGRIAIEYWFYYPFNDYNNKHESDWERIQVELDAADARAALATTPTRVVYSEHEGSEFADWGAAKLRIENDTHPVVYVSAGSHANHFGSALFLGRSASQGLGCDSTLDATTVVRPVVRTIPADPVAARRAYPWIGYQGAWGQREARAFYTGPTGPNTKDGWRHPFTWSKDAAPRSYAVPGGSVYGVTTTHFFCNAVGQGSVLFLGLTAHPGPTLAVLALAVLVVVWLVRRTSWGSSDPLPATRRRTVGQTVADAWELFATHPLLFLGIGSWVAAASVVAGLVGQLASGSPDPSGATSSSVWVALTAVVLVLMTLFSQAATVAALGELDAGRTLGPLRSYRLALRRAGPLVGTGLLWLVAVVVPVLTVLLAPLALVAVAAFALFVPVVQLEEVAGLRALRRSAHLVRHQVVKILLVLVLTGVLVSLLGGLLGSVVILVAQAPFVVVNLIPGVVQALLNPFVSLMLGLAFFHGRARDEEGDAPEPEPGPRAAAESGG